jgi:hypothetical protein
MSIASAQPIEIIRLGLRKAEVDIMDIVVRAAAVAALVVLALGVTLYLNGSRFEPVQKGSLPGGFSGRGLAMELARSVSDVKAILHSSDRKNYQNNRDVMSTQQHLDFPFIASYWLLFSLCAVLVSQRRFPYAGLIGAAAGFISTASALLDIREDIFILRIARANLDASVQPLIDQCRTAAVWKWGLLFLAMILLSALFIGRSDWNGGYRALAIPGVLIALSGALGLVTLPFDGTVEKALAIMLLGFLALSAVLCWAAFETKQFLMGL